jgi:hypothetical protein
MLFSSFKNSKLNKDLERCEKMNTRLNEQWNKSKKNIIIESSSEYYLSLSKIIAEKELQIKEFTDKLKYYERIESAYNSDKKVWYTNIEENNNKLNSITKQLEDKEKLISEYEIQIKQYILKINNMHDLNNALELENTKQRTNLNKFGNESDFITENINILSKELDSETRLNKDLEENNLNLEIKVKKLQSFYDQANKELKDYNLK